MWKHLSYRQFKDFFGDLGLTAWVKFNWLAEVPDGYGKIDLGLATWTYAGTPEHKYFRLSVDDIERATSGTQKGELLCFKYEVDTADNVYNHVTDETVAVPADNDILMVYDSNFDDPLEFAAANKGVWLIYKKAE